MQLASNNVYLNSNLNEYPKDHLLDIPKCPACMLLSIHISKFLIFCVLVRSFAVAIEETTKSSEMGFKNNEPCTLQITSSTVILISESKAPISWPFNCIRRYKCHPGTFMLEVGRKAPTGEGVFRFFTQEGQEIFEFLGKTVADRMSSKQEQSKSDITSSFSALSTQSTDNPNFPVPSAIAGKQNPFLDFTGGAGGGSEGVRFIMKRRTSSTPPPTPNECSRSPPQIEDDGGSYSHLRFKNEKALTGEEEGDYNQLARAKECSRFNKTRLSESSRANPSNNKALKLLGILRSNSAENVQAPESSHSESCELYSHLDFEKRNLKKSQSASNIIDAETIDSNAYSYKISDSSQHQTDNVYNRLNSDAKRKVNAVQSEGTYNKLRDNADDIAVFQSAADSTYDKLGASNIPGSHRHARPEPIIITDDAYSALGFAREQSAFEPNMNNNKPPNSQPNAYEDPIPNRQVFPRKVLQGNNGKSGIPENRPPLAKPMPQTSAKPVVAKKPIPVKPPRKPGLGDGESSTESTKDAALNQGKVGGNDFRVNLISQLKKNFEGQDQGGPRSPASPLSPPNSTKKLVEPFYAVSPFCGGNKPIQAAPSEYDVPSNSAPAHPVPENKQQIGFLYAVSPFHSGNQKETPNPDQNLYDTPIQQSPRVANALNAYDVPVQRPVADALNTYDVPVQRPVGNAAENLYDTPNQQNLLKMPHLQAVGNDRFPPSGNVQFTYAVSPFAGAHNNANQIRFRENGYADPNHSQEEAAYCEVPEVMAGFRSLQGYDPVGGVLSSGRPPNEPLYADPRE